MSVYRHNNYVASDGAVSAAPCPLKVVADFLICILNDPVTVLPHAAVQASSISLAMKRRKAKPTPPTVMFYADVDMTLGGDMIQHSSAASSIPHALSREPTLAAMLPTSIPGGEALEGLVE